MKQNVLLIVTSLLSILLLSIHVADDVVYGFEKGGAFDLITIPILVLWLYGTLLLAERRSGYIIILVLSLFGLAAPVLHMAGRGLGGDIANSSGGLFFIWTLLALGVTSLFSVILSIKGLWSLRRPITVGR